MLSNRDAKHEGREQVSRQPNNYNYFVGK